MARRRPVFRSNQLAWVRGSGQRGRPRLPLPCDREIFQGSFPSPGFVAGTLNNKVTHIRVFKEFLKRFYGKNEAESATFEELIAYGQFVAQSGVQKQVLSTYLQTVKVLLTEAGRLTNFDLSHRYANKWSDIKRMCRNHRPSQARILTWREFRGLTIPTKRFLLGMFSLACRLCTMRGITEDAIIKNITKGNRAISFELNKIKYIPEDVPRIATIRCCCASTQDEPDEERRRGMCFFHAFPQYEHQFIHMGKDLFFDLARYNFTTHSVRRTLAVGAAILIMQNHPISITKLYNWMKWKKDPKKGKVTIFSWYARGYQNYSLEMLPPIKKLILQNCT